MAISQNGGKKRNILGHGINSSEELVTKFKEMKQTVLDGEKPYL